MFMISLIHLLEAATCLLVVALFIQVSRCYMSFVRMEQAQTNVNTAAITGAVSGTLSVRINIHSSQNPHQKLDDLPVIELPSENEASTPAAAVLNEKESAPNDQILNDYIGEFFSESHETNDELAISTKDSSSLSIEEPSSYSEEVLEDSDEIIVVDTQHKIMPVILEQNDSISEDLPVLSEIADTSVMVDEDTIITVVEGGDETGMKNKIMSDKVVHAMLDEAHMVYPS